MSLERFQSILHLAGYYKKNKFLLRNQPVSVANYYPPQSRLISVELISSYSDVGILFSALIPDRKYV